jgi:hypothetical protein
MAEEFGDQNLKLAATPSQQTIISFYIVGAELPTWS